MARRHRCRNCLRLGHKASSCPDKRISAAPPDTGESIDVSSSQGSVAAITKSKQVCSICRKTGHNKKTCAARQSEQLLPESCDPTSTDGFSVAGNPEEVLAIDDDSASDSYVERELDSGGQFPIASSLVIADTVNDSCRRCGNPEHIGQPCSSDSPLQIQTLVAPTPVVADRGRARHIPVSEITSDLEAFPIFDDGVSDSSSVGRVGASGAVPERTCTICTTPGHNSRRCQLKRPPLPRALPGGTAGTVNGSGGSELVSEPVSGAEIGSGSVASAGVATASNGSNNGVFSRQLRTRCGRCHRTGCNCRLGPQAASEEGAQPLAPATVVTTGQEHRDGDTL